MKAPPGANGRPFYSPGRPHRQLPALIAATSSSRVAILSGKRV